MSPPLVTLTTDFGGLDGFVAAMKGVILSVNPNATLVDISHDIPPQDIAHGAYVFGTTFGYFPQGTIHLVVVDPGVGTARHPLLLVTSDGAFVAPDNGLLTYVLLAHNVRMVTDTADMIEDDEFLRPLRVSVPAGCSAYVLNRDEYWLKPVSNTFHGRDIFAPVAAHLSRGVAPDAFGERIYEIVCLNVPSPVKLGNIVTGRIIHVDRFGNLVSNIRLGNVLGSSVEVEIGGRRIHGLSWSYASATGLLAINGSHGYLEIAVRKGSAADFLGATKGTRVRVRLVG